MRFWLKTGLFCSIWSLSLAVVAAQPRMVQGRLADFMAQQADAQPKKGSEGFMVPNPAEKMAWQRLMQAFNAQAWIRVDSLLAAQFPFYERLHFVESAFTDRTFMVLAEKSPIQRGWGLYLRNLSTQASPWVLEVPHPKYDLHTERQGAWISVQLNAQFLMMAGAHRCANTAYSGCDGTTSVCTGTDAAPFAISDVAHSVETPFQWTHEVLNEDPRLRFVNLHGNSSSLCEDIFLSSTVPNRPDGLTRALSKALQGPDWTVGYASDGQTTCNLSGTTNVQGRHTNQSAHPCNTAATQATGRFIHIEQSLRVRQSEALSMRLAAALQVVLTTIETTEPPQTLSFTLLPQPAASQVRLQFISKFATTGLLRVRDVQGRMIYEAPIFLHTGTSEQVLSVQHWASGHYAVEVEVLGQLLRKMMIVAH